MLMLVWRIYVQSKNVHGHAPAVFRYLKHVHVRVNGVCGLINPEPKFSILDCVTGMVLLA